MKYITLLLLLLSINAFAVLPKNKLLKLPNGQLSLIVYQPTQFGYVEEHYLVGFLCISDIRLVYEREGQNPTISRLAIDRLQPMTQIDDVQSSRPLCFPSMSSQPGLSVEPVVNLPQLASALRADVITQVPQAYAMAAQSAQMRSQSSPTLRQAVTERNFQRDLAEDEKQALPAHSLQELRRIPSLDEMDFGVDIGKPFPWEGSF